MMPGGRDYAAQARTLRTLDDLERAAEAGEVSDVKGFGPKTEQNILEGIDFARQSRERQLLADAHPLGESIKAHFEDVDAVGRCEVAGSLRRWKPTIGDVDILAASDDGPAVVEAFREWPDADEVIEAGTGKASVRSAGIRVDLRVVAPEEFGSALQYFTGSRDHNIEVRNYAIARDLKVNEYGVFDVSDVDDSDAGQRVGERVAGETEESMYEALGLPWIPPELRENRGEIQAAVDDDLPDLVTVDDVRGELHSHTDASDGRATLEDLFPGYGQDLIAAGGLLIDAASDFNFYDEGDFLAPGPRRMPMYTASRPLFEHVARQRVRERDDVRLRAACRCVDYLLDDRGTSVVGVAVKDGDAGREELRADLVVDATGRTSRTPTWLEENGYEPPAVDEVTVDLAYSTMLVERPPDDRRAFWGPAAPPHTRGGGAAPIEGGYWQVVMQGVHGDHPPTDPDGFRDFAASLPFPDLARLLDRHPQASDEVRHYPFPSNRRHRYEDLDRFPDGLVVVGDAVASYNPIYGQGISVAALEALVLHHVLAAGGADVGARFFDRAADVVDVAWLMAVGGDFQFPETTGPKPRGTDLVGRYLSRLTRKAHADGALREALFRVIMMEVPPSTLLRPGVAWRVLRPGTPSPSTRWPTSERRSRETP